MKNFSFASICIAVTLACFPGVSRAGFSTVCYINSASYSTAEGGAITGTISRQSESSGLGSGDWNIAASWNAGIYVDPSGQAHPVTYGDVNGNGLYWFTIPAWSSSTSFSIPIANNSVMEYDRTATLRVQGTVSTQGARQTAAMTVYDDDATNGVYLYYNGNYYAGSQALPQYLTGASIRMYHNVNVYDRAVNYTISGTATRGVEFSTTLPATEPITIPNGSYFTDYPLTLADMAQTSDKTLIITLGDGIYKKDSTATTLTLTIQAPNPLLSVGVGVWQNNTLYSGTTIFKGGTGGSDTAVLRFYRNYNLGSTVVNYSRSGSAYTDGDYSSSPSLSGSLTIPDGSYSADVTITANKATQTATNVLNVAIGSGSYQVNAGAPSVAVTVYPDYPKVSVGMTNVADSKGHLNPAFYIWRDTYFASGGAKTVNYKISGTASNGVDYETLSGTASIPAGGGAVTVPIIPKPALTVAKTVTLTLTNGYYTIGYSNATAQISPDYPIINLQTVDDYAAEAGTNTGTFSLTRQGLTNQSLVVQLNVTGTATPGVDYVAIATNVTFGVGVTKLLIPVTPIADSTNEPAETVVLTLKTNAAYVLGLYTNAFVTIAGEGPNPRDVNSKGTIYKRGSGTNLADYSIVVPLDGLTGTRQSDVGYSYYYWNCYHYNATNSGSQTNITNRIAYNTPIASFGASWGPPLYVGQSYSMEVFSGVTTADPIAIYAYYRTNGAYAGAAYLNVPQTGNAADWDNFATNGFARTVSSNGLTTVLRSASDLSMGSNPGWLLTHTTDTTATNYLYLVCAAGLDHGQYMTLDSSGQPAYSLMYDLSFDARPAWRPLFLDQPQFQGQPLPPDLWNKSPEELLLYGAPVTNAIGLAPSACTNLDQSPELRRHPILDQFVSDMNRDPMALANYVQNEIELSDPIAYRDDGAVSTVSVNEGGVNRGALGVYLEGQGSPVEQCALLIYLLRQAGYPATYVFPPEGGLKMLDTRLSSLLRMRINGARDDQQRYYTTNQLITVNYPWVAVNVSNQWIHLFPWIKDTGVEEGLDLYDYLPAQYKDMQLWVKDYVYGKTNILAFATPDDDTPGTIFPRFLSATLQQNAPGVSVDDIGMRYSNRKHLYAQWSDFPRPTWTTNVSTAVESLSSSGITNVSPALTNIFDTVTVELFSGVSPTKRIVTCEMRMADLHNRKFFLTHTNTGVGTVQAILTLGPFRPNATNAVGSFSSSDATLTNKQVLTLNLDATDDSLNLRLRHRRQRALTLETALDPDRGFLDLIGSRQVLVDRPLRKGDVAAVCFNTGRVTPAMTRVHAQELWNMEQLLSTNSAATNQVSPDVYQGTLVYLMGMNYYQRATRFDDMNRRLFKVQDLSTFAMGLAKISPRRNSDGTLYTGPVDPIWPNVDMFFQEVMLAGNGSVRLDSGWDNALATRNYYNYSIADLSAQEHATLNKFFGTGTAVSTVKVLQLAQSKAATNGPLLELTYDNYQTLGQTLIKGIALKDIDPNMWAQVSDLFDKGGYYAIGWMPPGAQTTASGSFNGMAALVLGVDRYAALIGNNQHGGYADQLPYGSISPGNMQAMDLSEDEDDDYTMDLSAPYANEYLPAPEQMPTFDQPSQSLLLQNNSLVANPYQNQMAQIEGYALTGSSCTYYNMVNTEIDSGPVSTKTDDRKSNGFWSTVFDPVNTITGEFYVDDTDLSLPGPMRLDVRRNYGSQNLANNQLGYGWKLNYMPYLTVAQVSNIIYEAEADGSVLAFGPVGTNLWAPSLALNPTLNNDSTSGIGSVANRMNSKLSLAVVSGTNTWYLNGADGSLRVFQEMSFPLTNSPSLDRKRPYLAQWFDCRSNYYRFEYGTDSTKADFGQVRRIVSSGGNILRFEYDVYGRIVDAYSADGRRVRYDYDDHGDLVTVTRPDNSEINYEYQLLNWSTNGTTSVYSTHLLLREDKPDGRVLQNAYDSQRRVTNQSATVGADLSLVRSATFVYANDFNLTNITATITGTTTLYDYTNNATVYYYTNGLMRRVHDVLGGDVVQEWYEASETNAPAYPRSLKRVIDKRNLVTRYYYDSAGNLTNTTVQGDLCGDGNTNTTATVVTSYTNNLPSRIVDASGATNLFFYTNTWLMARQESWPSNGSVPAVTLYNYTSVSNAADGTASFGLRSRETRAAGSADEAVSEWVYSSRGYPTLITKYTGNADPAVLVTNIYNTRGELAWQTDADGRSVAFGYDPSGNLESREVYEAGDDTPVSWEYYYYNANGELTWSDGPRFDPEDYVWRDYDGAGRKTQEVHWRSQVLDDGSGVAAPAGDDLYAVSSFQYDPANNLVKAVDPRGNYSVKKYDALNRLVREEFYGADGTLLATNGAAYHIAGDRTNTFTALGGVTETQYTATGKPKYQKNADGSVTSWRYLPDGRPWREILGNNAYSETTYLDASRTVKTVFYSTAGAALETNTVTRDLRGNVIQRVDADGNVFTTAYDDLDRPKLEQGPPIISVTMSNSPGSIPDIAHPNYITNITYQLAGYTYDASGKTLTVTNALGEKTVTTRDALGRVVSVKTYAAGSVTPLRVTATAYSADHHSATVTEGTGASAISTTTYTDNDGHVVATVQYPYYAETEYTLSFFDKAGNRTETDRMSSYYGSLSQWSYDLVQYDGLNRPVVETSKDNAVTRFAYNASGIVTNRQMPGSLTWNATYSPAGQLLTEWDSNGSQTTRGTTNTYYAAGHVWAGLLATFSDGRGVTGTKTYDDHLRTAGLSTSGTLLEQQMSVSWGYNRRGLLTNVTQAYSSTNAGPSSTVLRGYDAYGELNRETVSIGSSNVSLVMLDWDSAGRRSKIASGSWSAGFQYRADGLMTASGGTVFGYGDNGLLVGRTNSYRSVTFTQRDGMGRPMNATTKVGAQALGEQWGWNSDGSPYFYGSPRADYSDSRNFAYGNWHQRLTQETFNLGNGTYGTNTYQFDNNTGGGLGVLTKVTGNAAVPTWTGGVDAFSRVTSGTNTAIRRTAWGTVNGSATLRGTLNGKPVDVHYDSGGSSTWTADLTLSPGTNTLTVYADHPSGQFTTNAVSTFVVTNTASDRESCLYDSAGNVTNRVWKNAAGQVTKNETLTWDAFGNLVKHTSRDATNGGFNATAIFDGLGRQLRTIETAVSNNVASTTNPCPLMVTFTYDPLVEFQFIGIALSQGSQTRQDWMSYGPDISGTFGGMQGVGGLETISTSDDGTGKPTTYGVLSDTFGNVLGGVTNKTGGVDWNKSKVSLYGPVDGYPSPMLTLSAPSFRSFAFRTRPPSQGNTVQLGRRRYDFARRAFLSADSLGHGSDWALNTAFGCRPSVYFDARGMCIERGWDEAKLDAGALSSGVFWGGMGSDLYSTGARTVNGVVQAGAVGSDMLGSSAAGLYDSIYGTDVQGNYQGYSKLYQNIYNTGVGPSSGDILTGTLEAEANIASLGLYGMGKGFGIAAATGDYTMAQDASLNALLLSSGARSMQANGINPWGAGYIQNAADQAMLSMFSGMSSGDATVPASFFSSTKLEAQALMQQGLSRSEAFDQIRSFNAGNADGYAFHFTSEAGGRGIVQSGELWATDRGLGGPGVYAGTTPTPNFFQRFASPIGWGINPGSSVRIPIKMTPDLQGISRTPIIPRWTTIIGEGQNIPLKKP